MSGVLRSIFSWKVFWKNSPSFSATAGNFGPGHVETAVAEDSLATPGENAVRNESDSSKDEVPLSQLSDKGRCEVIVA